MIPKYPLEISDQEGIADALNYLLSGPAGLGQNFDGFSDYNPLIIRPTFARPFTLPVNTTLDPSWYLRLPITNITVPTNPGPGFVVNFTGTYTEPPFQFGDRLRVQGVTPDYFDDAYYVLSSTTSSVTLYYDPNRTFTWPAYVSGGELVRDYSNFPVSTDCLAEVQVDSATQRIFITAQVEFTYEILFESIPPLPSYYTATDFDIVVQVNRYVISRNANGNQVYNFQKTVSQKIIPDSYGSTTAGNAQAIFTTVIDQQLNFGSYAYILEISFVTKPRLSNGTSPGLSGYRTTPGYLIDLGFQTYQLPVGTVGNFQVQSLTPGTTFTGIVPTIVSSDTGFQPLVDVTVYPDINTPLYFAGDHTDIPAGTVEVTLNTTNSSYNAGFVPGDVLKILGTDIGGSSPLNDLYLTVFNTDLRSSAVPGKFVMGLRNLTTQVIKE